MIAPAPADPFWVQDDADTRRWWLTGATTYVAARYPDQEGGDGFTVQVWLSDPAARSSTVTGLTLDQANAIADLWTRQMARRETVEAVR